MRFNLFIDESGIHKDTGYSSFVVLYIDVEDQDKINDDISEIEKSLGITNFHWSSHSSKYKWHIRSKFIEKSSRLSFNFKYLVVKNPINPQKELHNSLISMITENDIKNVYIDGRYPKTYEQSIKNSLRNRGLSVKKLRTVNDESFPVIRLADALAGLIRSYYDNPSKDSESLYKLIKVHKKHEPPF